MPREFAATGFVYDNKAHDRKIMLVGIALKCRTSTPVLACAGDGTYDIAAQNSDNLATCHSSRHPTREHIT
jgi:hypothetical protein